MFLYDTISSLLRWTCIIVLIGSLVGLLGMLVSYTQNKKIREDVKKELSRRTANTKKAKVLLFSVLLVVVVPAITIGVLNNGKRFDHLDTVIPPLTSAAPFEGAEDRTVFVETTSPPETQSPEKTPTSTPAPTPTAKWTDPLSTESLPQNETTAPSSKVTEVGSLASMASTKAGASVIREHVVGITIEDNVNFRAGPKGESPILSRIDDGAILTINKLVRGGTTYWFEIQRDGTTGYVNNRYVNIPDNAIRFYISEEKPIRATIAYDGAEFMRTPSLSFEHNNRIRYLSKGATVQILGIERHDDMFWVNIVWREKEGYILDTYLRITEDVDEAMPIPYEFYW